MNASCCVNYINLFIKTVTSQRFNEPHNCNININISIKITYNNQEYCTTFGYLIPSDHQLYRVTPLKTPFRLVISLLQSSPTRNNNHSQLFITLCHIYTAYNHTRSWLQSLITHLHIYTGWLLSYQLLSQITTDFTSSHFETPAEIFLREFTS
jgi:hypothetical protein